MYLNLAKHFKRQRSDILVAEVWDDSTGLGFGALTPYLPQYLKSLSVSTSSPGRLGGENQTRHTATFCSPEASYLYYCHHIA